MNRCSLNEGSNELFPFFARKILHFSESVLIIQCIISIQHALPGYLIHSIVFDLSSVNCKQLIAI